MAEFAAEGLLLGSVKRPEYPQAPESFITALAWNAFEIENLNEAGGKSALIYRRKLPHLEQSKATETYPRGNATVAWQSALVSNGLGTESQDELMAQAIADALLGVQITSAKTQAATPLSPMVALLQNLVGMTGKRNPAQIGSILEQLFALGARQESASAVAPSATELWLTACERRTSLDSLLRAIDASAFALMPSTPIQRDLKSARDWAPTVASDLKATPYTWLWRNWTKLTSDPWVDALPARVWTDWATTVLRLGFGMSFLWEASWFENLARNVVAGESPTWEELRQAVSVVLPWAPSEAVVSVRDVAPVISRRINRAHLIRNVISDWMKEGERSARDYQEVLTEMHKNSDLVAKLTHLLSHDTTSGNNIWEAVKFTLATRDSRAGSPDYYGLLRSRGRYLVVDPAPEWISVVASLSSDEPGSATTVGAVARNLKELGLRPELGDLIQLLERAGLARGSADADQAVEVASAY
jgi:hypothetical protein